MKSKWEVLKEKVAKKARRMKKVLVQLRVVKQVILVGKYLELLNVQEVVVLHGKEYISESHQDVIKAEVSDDFYQVATDLFHFGPKLPVQYPIARLADLQHDEDRAARSIRMSEIKTVDLLNNQNSEVLTQLDQMKSLTRRKSLNTVFKGLVERQNAK